MKLDCDWLMQDDDLIGRSASGYLYDTQNIHLAEDGEVLNHHRDFIYQGSNYDI